MRIYLLFACFWLAHFSMKAGNHQPEKHTANATTNFQKVIGGSSFEAARQVLNLSSGGYIMVGRTASHGDGDTDMHVVKLDANGEIIWEKRYGEEESEEANDIIETADGGYMILGNSDNYDAISGLRDMWLIKTDAEGEVIWDKRYGIKESINSGNAIIATPSGGYLIVGNSISLEDEAHSYVYAVNIDASGEVLWEKNFGGPSNEEAKDVAVTAEGFAIVGNTESYGEGRWDIWLLRIDNEGNEIANHTYGGKDNEMGNAVITTSDGGMLIGGYSYSFAAGSLDAWIVKIDKDGKEQWNKSFGGLSTDEAFSLLEVADGSFIMAGYTEVYEPNSNYENISTEGHNVFLVKTDASGKKMWERSIGGDNNQKAFALVEAPDGGLVLVGSTDEGSSVDALVMKLNSSGQ